MTNETIDIKSLISTFKKHFIFIIATTLAVTIAASVFVSLFVPKKYQSSVMLRILSTSDISGSMTASMLTSSEQLIKSCTTLFTTKPVLEDVVSNLDIELSRNSLKGMVRVSPIADTLFITITVEATDPELACTVANTYKDSAMREFKNQFAEAGSISSVEDADIATSPFYPSSTKIALLAAIASLVVAYVISFLVDFFNDSIKSDDDLSVIYQSPVLADILDFNSKTKGIYTYRYKYGYGRTQSSGTDKTGYGSGLPFAITEAFNTIRTNLLFATGTSKKKIITVTSSNPSEGKSVTVSNLAASFANAGYRVLLIDSDLRNPVQHKIHKIKSKDGLSTYLVGLCSLKDAKKTEIIKNLDLIVAGPIPPNPSELINSEAMHNLIASEAEKYDYIFIDTPPINVVSDVLLYNKYVSGSVLVVREGSTTYSDISEMLDKIKFADGHVLGFVRTFCEIKAKKYSYKNKYSESASRTKYIYSGSENSVSASPSDRKTSDTSED